MKFLVTSDWHLDASTAGFDRFDDVLGAVNVMVKAAIDERVDVFVFNGDLCDPDTVRAHRAVAVAAAVAAELHLAGIKSWWIAGNHDVVEDGNGATTLSALRSIPGAMVFEDATHFCGHRDSPDIVILPFAARSRAYDPGEFVATCERHREAALVFGHLNIAGITPGSETKDMPRGREVFWPLDEINAKFPKVLMVAGHYHRSQVFKDVRVVGSPARLTFGEQDNDPKYLIINASDTRISGNAVALEARPLITTTPDAPMENVVGALVRLYPGGESDEFMQQLVATIMKFGAAAVRVMPSATSAVTVLPGERAPTQRKTAREAIFDAIDASASRDKDALKETCERLMEEVGGV
jgi:DNA repair exonuclease SbcCD nuclease subunit